MENQTFGDTDSVILRRQAEAIARERAESAPVGAETHLSAAAQATLQELRVHQIELEMQNEELRRAYADLEAERTRYFDLYDMAPVGYVTISPKGPILEANLAACTILGTTRSMIKAQAPSHFILKDDQDVYYRHRKELLETGMSGNFELRMVKKDGTVFWAIMIPSLAKDGDGESVVRMVINDISERKRLEAALGETALENRNLMGEVQHRVKNSFSMICSMINLASIESPVPETKKILSQLDARVRSVSELYSLLYSSGSFTELRLDDYCARIASPLANLNCGVELATEMEGFTVSAKKAAPIGLILTELITNAVKYAFPGKKGTVTVQLTRTGTGATLEVRDDGVGLPAGFDIASSAGMGLNLVLGLTGQIKGVFSIDGSSAGTCCRVSFPVT